MFDDIVDRKDIDSSLRWGDRVYSGQWGHVFGAVGPWNAFRVTILGRPLDIPASCWTCFSIHLATGATLAGRWTLKQVQGDGFG